jgi:hypothetical protein
MATEFSVKVLHAVPLRGLLASAEEILASLFSDRYSIQSHRVPSLVVGDAEQSFECAIDDDTVVAVTVYDIGHEPDLGDDGGYWLTISADCVRNGSSVVLAALLAAAAARVVGAAVVDDLLIFGAEREVDSATVVQFLSDLANDGSFRTAAKAVAMKLGRECA